MSSRGEEMEPGGDREQTGDRGKRGGSSIVMLILKSGLRAPGMRTQLQETEMHWSKSQTYGLLPKEA